MGYFFNWFRNFEFGTCRDDTIVTGDRRDIVFARGGDDTISTGGGRDIIFAGRGNDDIDAGGGNDRVFAGSGDDLIRGGAGSDVLHGGRGLNEASRSGNGRFPTTSPLLGKPLQIPAFAPSKSPPLLRPPIWQRATARAGCQLLLLLQSGRMTSGR